MESATDIAGRISADLYLGMYACPVALIEITDDLSNQRFHSDNNFCCYSTNLDMSSIMKRMKGMLD